ncbi:Transglutaminase-like superfamily protein [Lachnospiraceae bacterium KH1T2]|nr:Transglutaminase-like superfamily protein [Lachnospiraceae bacterium KH1T2]
MKFEKSLTLFNAISKIVAFLLMIVMTSTVIIPSDIAHAGTEYEAVEIVDFADISNWTAGCYDWNSGKVLKGYEYRLRLNDYVTFFSPEYEIFIADDDYKVLVRELDDSFKFIRSGNYSSGDIFTPDESAKYLAIGIYNFKNDKKMTYEKYEELFDNGFEIAFLSTGKELGVDYDYEEEPEEVVEENYEEELEEVVEENYEEEPEEVVEENYEEEPEEVVEENYEDELEDEFEEDVNKDFEEKEVDEEILEDQKNKEISASENSKLELKEEPAEDTADEQKEEKEWNLDTIELADFTNWTEGCYSWTDGKVLQGYEYRLRLSEYVEFNNNSYYVSISDGNYAVLVREIDENGKLVKSSTLKDESVYEPAEAAKYLAIGIYNTKKDKEMNYEKYRELFENGFSVKFTVKGAKNLQESKIVKEDETLDEILIRLFSTDDESWNDVSKFKMKQSAMYVYRYNLQEKNTDFYVAFNAAIGQDIEVQTDSKGYVEAIRVSEKDMRFVDRYTKAAEAVEEAMALTDENMNDFEKALVLHDYLIDNVDYVASKYDNYAGYVLAYGKGICGGYASAYKMLLTAAGIKSHIVLSSNHAWNLVTVNGKQYHVDVTWDDTKGYGSNLYTYFMRSDEVFKRNHPKWTSYIYDDTADSVIYDDLFIHKIDGRLNYYGGSWYYVSNGSIINSQIDGKDMTTLVESDGKLVITSIEDGKLNYTEDGNTFELVY